MEVKGVTHLKNVLDRTYNYINFRSRTMPETHNSSNVFRHFICSTTISGTPVIPKIWQFNEWSMGVNNAFYNEDSLKDKFVFPIISCNNSELVPKRTADPIIGYLMGDTPCNRNSTTKGVKTPNGFVYYGCGGFLLDSDFNPLLILGGEYTCVQHHPEHYIRRILNPVCIINPVVFSKEDVISKYIVKKVIPFLSDYKVAEYTSDIYRDKRMKVIISPEISKFVKSPAKPNTDFEEELWKIAEENIDEILRDI